MFFTLLKKELFIEFRTREITISMIVFGLAIILTFAFSSNVSPMIIVNFAPGMFWIMILCSPWRQRSREAELNAHVTMIAPHWSQNLMVCQ